MNKTPLSNFRRILVSQLLFCSIVFVSPNGLRAESTLDSITLPVGFESRSLTDETGEHRYAVSIPDGAVPESGWPVILFLHGAGERGDDGIEQLAFGLATALEHQQRPFIAVFPQAHDSHRRYLTTWNAEGPNAARAMAILKQVEQDEQVDTSRRILCGWSMGGYGALHVAAHNPEPWAGVMSISGGETELLPLKELAMAGTSVWMIHGVDDNVVFSSESTAVAERMKAAGTNVTLNLVPNSGHDVWRKVFAHEQVWEWLNAPGNQSTVAIDFSSVDALPGRSEFITEQLKSVHSIPNVVTMRMGNQSLQEMATGMPNSIPKTALSGSLDDLHRDIQSGSESIQIDLRDLNWKCNLVRCELEGISGGRLRVEFELAPIQMNIGTTVLKSGKHSATTGPFSIVIGHRTPVRLSLEIQPQIHDGKLELVPLRQNFHFHDSNWYISHPEDVTVQSPTYTRYHIVTGIVGSLYKEKAEIEEQILSVVPTLLKYVEGELQSRQTPALGQLIWPLPVLVPEMGVAPSAVQTDRYGISVVLDMQAMTYTLPISKTLTPYRTSHALGLSTLPLSEDLNLAVSLSLVESLAEFAVSQEMAWINLADIPGDDFDSVLSDEAMKRLFSGESVPDDVQLVLRLVEPFVIRFDENSGNTKASAVMQAPGVDIEIWDRDESAPLATAHFSIEQKLAFHFDQNTSPATLGVHWTIEDAWTFRSITHRDESPTNPLNTDVLLSALNRSWGQFAASQSSQNSIPEFSLGEGRFQLDELDFESQEIHMRFRYSKSTSTHARTAHP